MSTPAFSVRDLSVTFATRRGPVTALSGIDLDLHPGTVHVVIGESASGKSVLAHALLDLLPRNVTLTGRRFLGGEDLTAAGPGRWRQVRARHLAFIPQSPASALNPVRRLGPLLAELARARGVARSAAWPDVAAALASFDLDPERIRSAYPHHLSGGMAQRVASSLALVGSPDVVIADEPTSGLDAELIDRTAAHLAALAERGAALLVITHDLTLARRLGGTTSVLYASQLLERRDTDALFDTPAHPYVAALLRARPECGGRPIPGWPPELTALPDHCVFAARCPHVDVDAGRVIDESGAFHSQRHNPRLALIQPKVAAGGERLTLRAPGAGVLSADVDLAAARRDVDLFGVAYQGIDQGDAVAGWLSQVLGVPSRLMRVPPEHDRVTSGETPGTAGYADGHPLLVTTASSLDVMNERIAGRGGEPVPMNRFRPNIVIDEWDEPHIEDRARRINAGDIELGYAKLAIRCVVTTVDQEAGTKVGPEPLRTLAGYRRAAQGGVAFGVKFSVLHPASCPWATR